MISVRVGNRQRYAGPAPVGAAAASLHAPVPPEWRFEMLCLQPGAKATRPQRRPECIRNRYVDRRRRTARGGCDVLDTEQLVGLDL